MVGSSERETGVIVRHLHLSPSASPVSRGDAPLVKTTSYGSGVLSLDV